MNGTYELISLGCKVNEYETGWYREQLEKAGYVEQSEGKPADIVVINTCTVTNTAAQKSRQKIRRARRLNPNAVVAVTGCYAQMAEPEVAASLEADFFIGAGNKERFSELVLPLAARRRGQSAPAEHETQFVITPIEEITDFESMPIGHFEHKHRAFLKIQDGCNQYCAYCQIPLARGPERSQIPSEVIRTAKMLAEAGHLEIVLTGIHTGRYSFRQTGLSSLLKQLLEETPEDVCYRISSIEITEVDDDLIALMKSSPRILPHLHIPIQSGCDETLKRMKRPYTIEMFKDKIQKIREQIPDVSISTDVICGFVQESDEEFETTVKNLQDLRFSFLHVFPYSRRKGTAADQMTGFVASDTVKERTARLLKLSDSLRLADMQRFTETEVLLEREDPNHPGCFTGYSAQYQPVRVCGSGLNPGRISVEITGIDNLMLTAVPAGNRG